MRKMTLSSIKKKGREEFRKEFENPDSLDSSSQFHQKHEGRLYQNFMAFLDKQLDIAYEAGKKEAIMLNKIVTPHLQKQMLKLVEDSLKVSP